MWIIFKQNCLNFTRLSTIHQIIRVLLLCSLRTLIIFPSLFVSSLPHHGWQNVINPSQTQHFFILSTWINRFSLIGAIITFINLNLFYMKNIFLVMFDTTKNASKCKVNLINWKTFFGMSHTQQTTQKKKPFSMVLLLLNPLSLSPHVKY